MPEPLFDELTPESRFKQIAAILAAGVVRRQRRQRSVPPAIDRETPESSPPGLEVFGRTRLCVSRRIGG
jgi:hypothetical protein